MRRHGRLNGTEQEKDDFLYKHFCGDGHDGLRDVRIQLIDQVNGEEELRDKEGQWAYKLNTLRPYGLNDNDFSLLRTHVQEAHNLLCTCVGVRGRLVARRHLSRLLLLKVESHVQF